MRKSTDLRPKKTVKGFQDFKDSGAIILMNLAGNSHGDLVLPAYVTGEHTCQEVHTWWVTHALYVNSRTCQNNKHGSCSIGVCAARRSVAYLRTASDHVYQQQRHLDLHLLHSST